MRSSFILTACLALCPLLSGNAHAQAYPQQAIRLVVPFATGGSTDNVARLVAEALTARLGQPVLVDNKPGGGANIGTNFVARAKPDGYTLLLATPTQTINSALYRNPPFNLKKDFVAVAMVGSSPMLLLAGSTFAPKSVPELIALAKQKPGKITFASGGVASTGHLAAELFAHAANIDVHHIPYKGAAQATTDVVGGQVDFTFGFIATAGPLIKAGRLRALAVAGARRLSELPDVPTMAELGLRGIDVDGWYGVLAPAGTPPDIVARLNREMAASIPGLAPKLEKLSMLAAPTEQAYFADWLGRETQMWAQAIKKSGVPQLD